MTPLAHRIVKELTLPLKDRRFKDNCGLLKRMSDIHCFECSEVWNGGAADALWNKMKDATGYDNLAFLPAPRTWIELYDPGTGRRVGHLLEEESQGRTTPGHLASVSSAFDDGFSSEQVLLLPLRGSGDVGVKFGALVKNEEEQRQASHLVHAIYCLLALINSPRIVGRVTHLPHRGLERALIAKRQSVGHWPLHAWHEVKLSITPPDAAPGEIVEGHLTGSRALHFVRQHLRIRLGKLELVSAHWRGDAQLGIKQTKYAVVH